MGRDRLHIRVPFRVRIERVDLMIRIFRPFLISVSVAIAFAQSAGSPVVFEVASVKRLPLEKISGGLRSEITATSVHFLRATIGNCIEWAYDKTIYEVV